MNEKNIIRLLIAICILLIILSIVNLDIPGPADWRVSWTSWIGSVVGIVVAARIFWKSPGLIQLFLDRGKNPSP